MDNQNHNKMVDIYLKYKFYVMKKKSKLELECTTHEETKKKQVANEKWKKSLIKDTIFLIKSLLS